MALLQAKVLRMVCHSPQSERLGVVVTLLQDGRVKPATAQDVALGVTVHSEQHSQDWVAVAHSDYVTARHDGSVKRGGIARLDKQPGRLERDPSNKRGWLVVEVLSEKLCVVLLREVSPHSV